MSRTNLNRAHTCPRNAVWMRYIELIQQPTDQSIAAGPLEKGFLHHVFRSVVAPKHAACDAVPEPK